MRIAKHTFTLGLNGSGFIQLHGDTPKGERIAIDVEPEFIRKLARALEHTASVGHAVWHLSNPDEGLPCLYCKPQTALPRDVLPESITCPGCGHHFVAGEFTTRDGKPVCWTCLALTSREFQ